MVPDLNNYFYKYYITYDKLYELTYHAFYGKTDADKANVFIDMNGLTRSLFETNTLFSFKDTQTPIASAFINLVAHLRSYYLSRHNSYLRFYIIWGENRPESARSIFSDYNAHYLQAFDSNTALRKILYQNIELMELICPYIPDVYFINVGQEEVGSGIAALFENTDISNLFSSCPNIIYTSDPFLYQLILYPNTFVFRPKKRIMDNGQRKDNSWVVNKSNLYDGYRLDMRYSKSSPDILDYRFYKDVIGICGIRNRHIRGKLTYNSAIKLIEKIVSHYNIDPNYPFDLLCNIIDEENTVGNGKIVKRGTGYNFSDCIPIYNALNISQYQYPRAYSIRPAILKGVVDLTNANDIREINDKYFINYPLDLMGL